MQVARIVRIWRPDEPNPKKITHYLPYFVVKDNVAVISSEHDKTLVVGAGRITGVKSVRDGPFHICFNVKCGADYSRCEQWHVEFLSWESKNGKHRKDQAGR